MRHIYRSFDPGADRYKYDGMFTYAEGYAQVDTHQDAWYFGIWTNPKLKIIATYAEGDVTVEVATTDAESTSRPCP